MTTATAEIFSQLSAARANVANAKSAFKVAVCSYFESQGASRAKLPEILQGVVAVAEYRILASDWVPSMFGPELGPDPISKFSAKHHKAIESMMPLYEVMASAQSVLNDAELEVSAYNSAANRGR